MSISLADIEAVYRRRGGDFFRFALARTGDPEAARDAVQDGFARAIRGRRLLRQRDALEAWLARCVINAAHDARRRGRLDDGLGPALPLTSGGGEAASTDPETTAVRVAVRQLPGRQRDALFLRYYLDFDYRAIADTLGVRVGTVSATLNAARASLAQSLQEVAR